jgi:hypothetical protein
MSNNITDYNKKIAELVLKSVAQFIEQENKLIHGGGAYKGEMPLAMTSTVNEPALLVPSSSLSGGPRPRPRSHVFAPEKRRKQEAPASKQEIIEPKLNEIEGAGMKKKRGRPAKKVEEGGKFNFVKSLKSVGKEIAHTGKEVASSATKRVINKGLNHVVDYGIKALTNPAVDAGLEDAGEVALMAAGMKKKRAPSRRNILIGQLMKKHKCTLAQASKMIKDKGLK